MDEEKTRVCPKCGKTSTISTAVCPKCHFRLHWNLLDQHVMIDYLQCIPPNIVPRLAIVIAIVGQLLLIIGKAYFNEVLGVFTSASLNSITIFLFGHIFKTVGETTLLYLLMKGLGFEKKPMTITAWTTIILIFTYHCLAVIRVPLATVVSPDVIALLTNACAITLILGECTYAFWGYRLFDAYEGALSHIGGLMAICVLAHLVLNVVLHLSGKNIYCDLAISLITIFYFYYLGTRFLDHKSYKKRNAIKALKG